MYFEYEMSAFPMSLFKDGLMRKPDKPSLRKVLMPESIAVKKGQKISTTENTTEIKFTSSSTDMVCLQRKVTSIAEEPRQSVAKIWIS